MAQVLPGDASAVVIVVDGKRPDGSLVDREAPRSPPLDTLSQLWRRRRSARTAYIVLGLVGALLCVFAATQVLASVDVEAAVSFVRVALFLAAYVGAWAVLVRVYQWINTT